MVVRVDDGNTVEENVAREVDALAVDETVAVGLDVVDGDIVAEPVSGTVPVDEQPSARCDEMFGAHGYPPEDERAHTEPLT